MKEHTLYSLERLMVQDIFSSLRVATMRCAVYLAASDVSRNGLDFS
ncbi:MAG: hypothetical protein KFH87_05880 [Bacteroidetes bacterium]|nr:hypothetical protein [Bacteroidota bacterium]